MENGYGVYPSYFKAVAGISEEDQKRFPVENVSWEDAQLYLAKLNDLEKQVDWVYRLPKAIEWDYACRGGPLPDKFYSAFDFYFEKPTNQLLPGQANFNLSGLKRPRKVGSYQPNRLGLYDMHGNVQEWCADKVPANPKDPKGASLRVSRGGGPHNASGLCRAASRNTYPPSDLLYNIGLRLARVPVGAGVK